MLPPLLVPPEVPPLMPAPDGILRTILYESSTVPPYGGVVEVPSKSCTGEVRNEWTRIHEFRNLQLKT